MTSQATNDDVVAAIYDLMSEVTAVREAIEKQTKALRR